MYRLRTTKTTTGSRSAGPIRIPHLYDGRNKTFGHYSQEWYKQNNEDTDSSTVPTKLEKTGDFTDFRGTGRRR